MSEEHFTAKEHKLLMREQRWKWVSIGLVTGFLFCAVVFTLGWQYGVESIP